MIYNDRLTAHLKCAEFALGSLRVVQLEKFAERYYHGDWREMTLADLQVHLISEVSELARALRKPWETEECIRECADVANYAAIIADVLRRRE